MTQFKRQKSREKFTTLAFGPSENQQPNRINVVEFNSVGNGLTKPPNLATFDQESFDRDSHYSKRSNSTKRKAKQATLLDRPNEGGQQNMKFEPIDVNKFRGNEPFAPIERDHSESSRRSSKSKRKPKDNVLIEAPTAKNQKYQIEPERPKQNPITTIGRPQPAPNKQVIDLTQQKPMESFMTDNNTSERQSSKSAGKKKLKENSLLDAIPQQPYKFNDIPYKQIQSIGHTPPSTSQIDYSVVQQIHIESPNQTSRQNSHLQDRKRRQNNRLGRLFEEQRNKSRSIENISKITENSSRRGSRIGELLREKKSQEKSKLESKMLNTKSNMRMEHVQMQQGDKEGDLDISSDSMEASNKKFYNQPMEYKRNQVGAQLCSFVKAYQNQPVTMPIELKNPSANTIPTVCENSPTQIKNSFLKYSVSPPKEQDNFRKQKASNIGQESLMFNFQEQKEGRKKGLAVFSKDAITKTSKPLRQSQVSDGSGKANSKEKLKKIKDSSLADLTKPKDQKFFDFRIGNSPNRVNDSFYDDVIQPLEQPAVNASPAVITFDDEPSKTFSHNMYSPNETPIQNHTTDNFYQNDRNGHSLYQPSVDSARSSGMRHTYSRPPTSKKSNSSRRSSSKEGSLFDGSDDGRDMVRPQPVNKQLTLNQIAKLKKTSKQQGYPMQNSEGSRHSSMDRSYDSGGSSGSKNRKKEGDLMNMLTRPDPQGKLKFRGQRQYSQVTSVVSKQRKSKSREKDMMIDSSKVTNWLPQDKKKPRRIEESRQTSQSYKSSLDEFIKPSTQTSKQVAGAYYLNEFIAGKQYTEDTFDDEFYEQEQQVNFNQMFEKKRNLRRRMPRTQT